MDDCIFCKIIKNEIPAKKVYETDKVLVFLDINPIARGHMLVISKEHFTDVFDISDEYLCEIMETVKKMSEKCKTALGADGVNLLNANGIDAQQSVFHFHFHVVPRYKNDSLNTWPQSDYRETDFDDIVNRLKS